MSRQVATEKVHGANLVVATDGERVRIGKRKAWLSGDVIKPDAESRVEARPARAASHQEGAGARSQPRPARIIAGGSARSSVAAARVQPSCGQARYGTGRSARRAR